MFLKRIVLRNFRNYEEMKLEFDSKFNIFIGNNGQGKTNLLEAIYFLGTGKSHRTNQDKELVSWGKEKFELNAFLDKQGQGNSQVEWYYSINDAKKRSLINGVEKNKLSDVIGFVNVVLFSPDDLYLVKGDPGERRKFINHALVQIFPSYSFNLISYQKALTQRNKLIQAVRQGHKFVEKNLFSVLNEQLAEYGSKIIIKRAAIIKKLNEKVSEIYRQLSGNKEKADLIYQPSFAITEGMEGEKVKVLFEDCLQQKIENEKRRGFTLVGPHRDDLIFTLDGNEAKHFGSQGQQRTFVLAVKLAEAELFKEITGEYPILLLDDVLSELDAERRSFLLRYVEPIQTFITSASLKAPQVRDSLAVFNVCAGNVKRC